MNVSDIVNPLIVNKIKERNIVDEKNITLAINAVNNSSKRIDVELSNRNLLSDGQLAYIYASANDKEIGNVDVIGYDEKIVLSVSKSFVKKHHILPLRLDLVENNPSYIVACGDLLNNHNIDFIKLVFGDNTRICYTNEKKVEEIFEVVSSKNNVSTAINEYHDENVKEITKQESKNVSDVSTAPTVKLVESILKEAIASKASDIHIEPYESEVRVRNRIDGVLYETAKFNSNMYGAISTRLKIMAGLNITERRIPQDGRFSIMVNDTDYDFRLSTLPIVYGEKIVIRILDNSAFQYSFSELGFQPEKIDIINSMLKQPYGIILLTGPTGCGKSTTLYSFIRSINKEGINIVSVEDPVEYSIAGINQVQVNNKVNMTFASALRSILRQDPNVIMIGEIRDEETAHIAIRSAITGHLVFSTIHTNDAVGAISRLTDMGVEDYLVADALQAVIAQRLVRRLCPECKKKVKTTLEQMNVLGINEPHFIYEPVGCPACHNTGYKGRIGIYELLKVNDEIREFISTKQNSEKINDYLKKSNYSYLKDECIKAILRGDTSYQELFTITSDEVE